jgi:conjugative relaxase-like TrwC/TraI family protein
MVSFSDGAMTIEQAGSYYRVHYSAAGYYAEAEQGIVGHAVGRGAQFLALSDLTAEQFDALLLGRHPTTQAELRTKATHGDSERAGWDCTLSPPKSISIQALVCGDEQLIEADREAAVYAIREVEACALARRHGGKEWVETGNVVAIMFEHYDSRESIHGEHGPMPQLHHHFFIANMTRLANDEWRSLDPKQIYKARRFIDAVYIAELAKRVQQLGYDIVRKTDGSFELASFTRRQIEAFSERAMDIERTKRARGISNPSLARDIVLETRKPKRDCDPVVLKAERETLARQQGIDLNYRPAFPQLKPARVATSQTADAHTRESLDFADRHLSLRYAVIDHRELVTAALRHGIGATDLSHVQSEIDARQKAGKLIAAGHSYLHPLDTYTTPRMVSLERENLRLVHDHMQSGRPIAGIRVRNPIDGSISVAGTDQVREWVISRGLLPDQIDAAVLTLTTPCWASAIEGLAGTAKTSLVGSLKEYMEGAGWTVRGLGVTTGSAKALQAAGIEAQTIAKLLAAEAAPPKRGPEAWFIDESSLLATVPTNRLLKLAGQLAIDRIIFVGDQRQHLAIEAGSPVRQFLADNLAVAELTTIRRQEVPELRRAVELAANGRTGDAIDLLAEQNRVIEVADPSERYVRIAADYLDAYEARQSCAISSPANDERRVINQAVRNTLVEHGYVSKRGRELEILIKRDLTPAQLQHPLSYHEGDVIYFVRGSRAQSIPKQAYLRVGRVTEDSLTLRFANGREFEFDPSRWKGLLVHISETRTIAVGDRIEWRAPDNRRRIANHEFAVVKTLTGNKIEVMFDSGRWLKLPLDQARHIDLGYATTSHALQGATVDREIAHIDSRRSVDLINQRQFYVSTSRERKELRVYTDDLKSMRRAVAREQEKELALDVVQKKQSPPRMQSLGRP